MEVRPSAQMVSMMMAKTQGLAGVALLRKQQEIQVEQLQVVDDAPRAAPPKEQTYRVDKTA